MQGFVEFRHIPPTRAARTCFVAGPILLLGACSGDFSTLDPAGPAAAEVARLWWVMLAGALVILTGVVATALWSLRRRERPRTFSDARVLIGWGLVFPTITLTALMIFALAGGERLFGDRDAPLDVSAHARQFAWTFTYADGTETPVLHVAAGQPFRLRITSEDVIHSFWVPRLGGKMDAIPGRENIMVLEADAPGRYRGLCAEYCGIGHAHMMLSLIHI